MKNAFLLKTLLDFLFIVLPLSSLGVLFSVTFLIAQKYNTPSFEPLSFILLFSVSIGVVFFIRALYFLRKVATGYMRNKIFTSEQTSNMIKSGTSFILFSGISLVSSLLDFVFNLTNGELKLEFSNSQFYIVLILSIGLFLKIQGKVIAQAQRFKEDTDLTI